VERVAVEEMKRRMIEVRMMLDKKRKGKKNAKERSFISFAPFPPRTGPASFMATDRDSR
jgi:hypothetical protein